MSKSLCQGDHHHPPPTTPPTATTHCHHHQIDVKVLVRRRFDARPVAVDAVDVDAGRLASSSISAMPGWCCASAVSVLWLRCGCAAGGGPELWRRESGTPSGCEHRSACNERSHGTRRVGSARHGAEKPRGKRLNPSPSQECLPSAGEPILPATTATKMVGRRRCRCCGVGDGRS